MKYLLLTIISVIIGMGADLNAQTITQEGYVRTVGRPDNKKGVRLPKVIIRVKGMHNAVITDANGHFSIPFNNAKEGIDGYYITDVRLRGYEINEKEIIGRKFVVTSAVPHEIVMVSLAEKGRIEEKVRHNIELRYQEKLQQLERDKEKLGAEYDAKIAQLESQYENRERMIDDMVNRYAYTDYAKLDTVSAQINMFIENGELERADSVIQAMNIVKLEQDYHQLDKEIKKDRKTLEDRVSVKKKMDDRLRKEDTIPAL